MGGLRQRIEVDGRPRTARQVERMGRWANESVYLFTSSALRFGLKNLPPRSVGGEAYLTDAVNRLAGSGRVVRALKLKDRDLVLGFNTPEELHETEKKIMNRRRTGYPHLFNML